MANKEEKAVTETGPQRFILQQKRFNRALIAFTRSIWSSGARNAGIRADYYKELYDEATDKNNYIKKGKLLDIGARDCVMSLAFSKDFDQAYAIDISFPEEAVAISMSRNSNLHLVLADTHNLPFDNNTLDVVTAISVVEHVQHPELLLQEAIRVLKPGGQLVVQIPNRFFPIEPHTGLLFVYYLPYSIRKKWLNFLGYSNYLTYCPNFPSRKEVHHPLRNMATLKTMKTVVLPPKLIPPKLKPLYSFLVKIGMVKVLPQSWLAIYTKK
jgi:ubiquinone/menaquinone biosynthesis C-methylase UbiE